MNDELAKLLQSMGVKPVTMEEEMSEIWQRQKPKYQRFNYSQYELPKELIDVGKEYQAHPVDLMQIFEGYSPNEAGGAPIDMHARTQLENMLDDGDKYLKYGERTPYLNNERWGEYLYGNNFKQQYHELNNDIIDKFKVNKALSKLGIIADATKTFGKLAASPLATLGLTMLEGEPAGARDVYEYQDNGYNPQTNTYDMGVRMNIPKDMYKQNEQNNNGDY